VDIFGTLQVVVTWESDYGKILMEFLNGEIGSHHKDIDGQPTRVGKIKE
jgi:hypothetical protein